MIQSNNLEIILERLAKAGKCKFIREPVFYEGTSVENPFRTTWIISKGDTEIWAGQAGSFTWNDFDMAVEAVLEWFK